MLHSCLGLLLPILVIGGVGFGGVSPANVVVQPSKIPGNWRMYDPPLPPIEQVMRGPQAGKMIYGLYTWAGEYRTYRDCMKKVGWPAFRIAGPMDDETMRMVAEDGVEVMQTLGLRVHGEGRRRPDYDSDETFIADYLKGIDAYLTRYGPGGTFFKDNPGLPQRPIVFVEIWNEPNFQYMIPPDDRPRPEVEADREALYAKVLPAAYSAVKGKWPTVKVVGFGTGGSGHGDVRFIQHVHEKNPAVKNSYDILSTHPYVTVPPEAWSVRSWGGYGGAQSLKQIRDILTRFGTADRPIWYTEVGWTISKEGGGFYELTRGRADAATPLLQAAYICRQYALSLRLGVQRVHIMFATDTDNTNKGVFARDGSWRAAAYAVQTMIRMLPDPRIVSVISDGAEGFYAYQFDPGSTGKETLRSPVVMAWNVAGPKVVDIPCKPGRAVVTDMLGNSAQHTVEGGVLAIEVGPCPVYIEVSR